MSRADGGQDSAFSLEPDELTDIVRETESAWQARGKVSYGLSSGEHSSAKFRRSLYVAEDMKTGDTFTKDNLRVIRPGFGLPPKYYDMVLNRKACRDLKKGTPVSWDVLL